MSETHSCDEDDLFGDSFAHSPTNDSGDVGGEKEAASVLRDLATEEDDVLGEVPSAQQLPAPPRPPRQGQSTPTPSGALANAFTESEAEPMEEITTQNGAGGEDRLSKYIFSFPKCTEWTREYNDIKEHLQEPGMKERYEALRDKFREYLFDLKKIFLSKEDAYMARRTMSQRISLFLGLRMDYTKSVDFAIYRERQTFVRTTFASIWDMSLKLQIVQPINGALRTVSDIECDTILRHICCKLENNSWQVMLAWQDLGLIDGAMIAGQGLPKSFENMYCPPLKTVVAQYVHYILTCIARNDIKIDFHNRLYAPQYTKSEGRNVNTRFFCPLQRINQEPFKLEDLVSIFSKAPYRVLRCILGYMGVRDGKEVPTGKFLLNWNEAHAATLMNDLLDSGKNKGQSLVNEINRFLASDTTDRIHLLPSGEIVFAFQNMMLQATPVVRCFDHRDMPDHMRSFQFFEQDMRLEVIELVNQFAVIQDDFCKGELGKEDFLAQSLDIVGLLREQTQYLEECLKYQNWEEGTINAYYAFVLPQMICRGQWNHTNEQILSNIFTANPSGLLVVLVGITGSGKTVLADLVNFIIPDEHRVNLSVGGGQKEFQLTQLKQKPHALFIELPDARESLKTLSKELLLQVVGGGSFTIDVKYGVPQEFNKRCFGFLAATNDQTVEFCHDEYSDGRDMNASERRTLIFVLNHTHVQTEGSSVDINKRLRSQVDSYIAASFILFNVMRQVYTEVPMYNMICGKFKEYTPIFGTQLADFKQNINNNGDTYRKLFLMEGLFVSRADKYSHDEDNILCIPMQVLVENINARLTQLKKQTIFQGTIKTYLERIFNDPDSDYPTIYVVRHKDFLWRGKHYKDDDIVFGITLSFGASKRPFLSPVELQDLQHRDPDEYDIVQENIRMHLEGLTAYDDPIALFVKMHIMKVWRYTPNDEDAELTASGDSYYGVQYKTLLTELAKWCERTCFTNVEQKCTTGPLTSPKTIEYIQNCFREYGWEQVTISKKVINYEGAIGSLIAISNVIAMSPEEVAIAHNSGRTTAAQRVAERADASAYYSDSGASARSTRRGGKRKSTESVTSDSYAPSPLKKSRKRQGKQPDAAAAAAAAAVSPNANLSNLQRMQLTLGLPPADLAPPVSQEILEAKKSAAASTTANVPPKKKPTKKQTESQGMEEKEKESAAAKVEVQPKKKHPKKKKDSHPMEENEPASPSDTQQEESSRPQDTPRGWLSVNLGASKRSQSNVASQKNDSGGIADMDWAV